MGQRGKTMKIQLINSPYLRDKTNDVAVEEVNSIIELIPQMTQLMNSLNGLGLAANQVGLSKRFFIMKVGEDVDLIMNPTILEIGERKPFVEGCLSIPGTSATTQRARYLKLRYKDQGFNDVEREFHGMDALIIQHEVDHLDGKLYIDALPPMKKMLALKQHKDFLNKKGRMK